MFKSRTNRVIALLTSVIFIAWMGQYWFLREVVPIYPYQPDLDREAVIQIFKQNYFWLTTDANEGSAVSYFEWQLDTCSSSYNLLNRGNLKMYVYRVEGTPRAFIAYHGVDYSSAKILYLAVDEKHRCQGCAAALMQFALDDLKRCGYTRVKLLTRIINDPAQALYKKFGFKEYRREEPLVYYERVL